MQNILKIVQKFFINFFLNGKIPFFSYIKIAILLFSCVPLVKVFIDPSEFIDMGENAINLLIFLLLLRPFAQVLPEFKILKKLLPLRKELGILCASFTIAHSIGYFLQAEIILPSGFFYAYLWDWKQYYFWGIIGTFSSIILLLTSNTFSIQILKKYWKPVQRFSYVFFITAIIHVVMIKSITFGFFSGEVLETFLPFFLWIIVNIFAWKNIKIYPMKMLEKFIK